MPAAMKQHRGLPRVGGNPAGGRIHGIFITDQGDAHRAFRQPRVAAGFRIHP
jgi:hypothetical protein